MNCVLVKIGNRLNSGYQKMLSNCNIFSEVDWGCIDSELYDPETEIGENTWFCVEGLSKKTYCIDLLRRDFDSKEYDDFDLTMYNKISWVIDVRNDTFYFQKITASRYLKGKMLSRSDKVEIVDVDDRIILRTDADALYRRDIDTLYFKKLSTISSLFVGIDALYREATDDEVKEFFNFPFIKLSNGFCVERVSQPNRKRIALANITLKEIAKEQLDNLMSYIAAYSQDIPNLRLNEAGEFVVEKDDELKAVLYGLMERYYTTVASGKKYIANSVIPVKN